jgi:prophage antirepressor-like protein
MNSVSTFTFANHDIRVVVDEKSNFWFVGRDICFALGYTNPNSAMRMRDQSDVPRIEQIVDRMGRKREVRVLTSAEVLTMIQRSKAASPGFERINPTLPGFESWLVNDVLPKLNTQAAQSRTGDRS